MILICRFGLRGLESFVLRSDLCFSGIKGLLVFAYHFGSLQLEFLRFGLLPGFGFTKSAIEPSLGSRRTF